MARYLNERETGWDTDTIGFPNIGDCMGVVLQTQNRLYGFHAMPGDVDRISGFLTFIQTSGLHGTETHLYGSAIPGKRYAGDGALWKTEMTRMANGLLYHGPVSGFDLPSYPDNKNKTTDTTYVEYRRDILTDTCKIYYKRMSKMTLTEGNNHPADPVQRLTKRKGVFVVEDPTVQTTLTADIVRTYWNKGQMHSVPATAINTCDVP